MYKNQTDNTLITCFICTLLKRIKNSNVIQRDLNQNEKLNTDIEIKQKSRNICINLWHYEFYYFLFVCLLFLYFMMLTS